MFKRYVSILAAAAVLLSLSGCGQTESTTDSTAETTAATTVQNDDNDTEVTEMTETEIETVVDSEVAEESEDTVSETEQSDSQTAINPIGTVANTIAADEDALVSTYAEKFTQKTYTDPDTGLSITYNLFLPDSYDESKEYPMVVFIADSSCAGTEASRSLTQGLGALVWTTDEWQVANECIVAVPTYPETILDDHGSYTTTEFVELTKRFIDYMSSSYAVDTDRIYGTGQSMGCMTTLILASEYPDLYAACMFVDGQWDVTTLSGLENQTFVYFAAEDDENAFNGMSEVMAMFDSDGEQYSYNEWDGTWGTDELSSAASEMFSSDITANFISWTSGTIEPSGMMGGAAYHMASFDYAYNCIAVMEWLFQQTR